MTKLTTPGLRIEWTGQRHRLYATLVHVGSGAVIRKFTAAPIEGGKRRFAAKVDAALSGIDWTRDAESIVADESAKRAVYSL